jgi:hypothetical protein
MCDSSFSADFFNNVAAVAVVLLFTKVVTHRSRKEESTQQDKRRLAALHVVAVLSAAVAVGFSLLATGVCWKDPWIHIAAVSALVITSAILLTDIVIEEFPKCWPRRLILWRRSESKSRPSELGSVTAP